MLFAIIIVSATWYTIQLQNGNVIVGYSPRQYDYLYTQQSNYQGKRCQ